MHRDTAGVADLDPGPVLAPERARVWEWVLEVLAVGVAVLEVLEAAVLEALATQAVRARAVRAVLPVLAQTSGERPGGESRGARQLPRRGAVLCRRRHALLPQLPFLTRTLHPS